MNNARSAKAWNEFSTEKKLKVRDNKQKGFLIISGDGVIFNRQGENVELYN